MLNAECRMLDGGIRLPGQYPPHRVGIDVLAQRLELPLAADDAIEESALPDARTDGRK